MRHEPVLLQEVLDGLRLSPGMTIVDCTLGDGGHAEKILEKIGKRGALLGLDADAESLLRSKNFLREYADQTILVRSNFEHLEKIIDEHDIGKVDGILIDLGWSSPQFAERQRGFSFLNAGEPLDMRYDPRVECEHVAEETPTTPDGRPLYGRCTAAEVLNKKSEEELEEIFRLYGEEKLSRQIARGIIEKREVYPLETVGDLVDIVLSVYRKKLKTDKEIPWVGGLHPATKTFQALRIAVNDELGVIERVLPQAIEALKPGGRLAVITFHSLEDRIVKHYFKKEAKKTVSLINKKPIVASREEAEKNTRARSAKLRIIEKKTI